MAYIDGFMEPKISFKKFVWYKVTLKNIRRNDK